MPWVLEDTIKKIGGKKTIFMLMTRVLWAKRIIADWEKMDKTPMSSL